MPTVTFLEKAYGSFTPQSLGPVLESVCEDLRVHIRIKDKTAHGWIQAEVDGEDEIVALQLFDREIGLAPINRDGIEKFSLLRGSIFSSEVPTELNVDVGVFAPRITHATVSLQRLQAQLGDGKQFPLQSLVDLYCLHNNMPVSVKILGVDVEGEKEAFEAEFSEQQLSLFNNWLRSSFDRLMVFGAQLKDVEYASQASKHFRDVIRIESLGLLEHAILCKLGTDAIGLIPASGRYLRSADLASFSPRKILKIVGRQFL